MLNNETKIIINTLSELKGSGLIIPKGIQKLSEDVPHITKVLSSEKVSEVYELLKSDSMKNVIGYFKNHRPNSVYANISDEYKVQDLLFCILSNNLKDLQYEDPHSKPRGSLTSTRMDLISKSNSIVIETKFSSSKHKAIQIEKEISEDIIKYGRLKKYKYLFFYIYCSGYTFPNSIDFEDGFTDIHEIASYRFNTYCIIKP